MDREALRGDRLLERSRRIVHEVFGPVGERPFAVRYWDRVTESGPPDASPCVLHLRHAGALRRMLWPPSELALAEAFVRGDFDLEGNIEMAIGVVPLLPNRIWNPVRLGRLAGLVAMLPRPAPGDERGNDARADARAPVRTGRRHDPARDASVTRFHYEVGNEFYALWLDERMVYSCGLFARGTESIEEAQVAKLDLVCRKLRLSPGERFLDVGCGWGALVCHAARRYGVNALGVTVSPTQASWAREQIGRAGLADRCDVHLCDYRDLARYGSFDKIASVGMCEHVGSPRLDDYFGALYARLRPGGVLLNHSIVSLDGARRRGMLDRLRSACWREGTFIDRYIFPDGELLPLSRMIGSAERVGFETCDAERLRPHYTLTLRHWRRRLEAREAAAIELVGEQRYRAWRLYLAASAQAFESGRIGVTQQLLARPDAHGRCTVPATRDDIYRARTPSVNKRPPTRWRAARRDNAKQGSGF